LKRKEVLGIVHHPDNSNLREKVIAMASHDLRDEISAPEIVNACDTGGISRMGYQSIFGLVRKNKRVASMHVLPKPMHVRVSRIEATKKVHDLIGTYKCIEEKMTLKDGVEFQFNAQNNIFLDVKKVQAAMIKLYSLSLNGKTSFHSSTYNSLLQCFLIVTLCAFLQNAQARQYLLSSWMKQRLSKVTSWKE
jgi:hypothetical protein